MFPILFEIPGVGWPIRSFGVMLALGFVLGAHVWSRLAARFGDDPEQDPERVSQLVMWILLGVVGGARLMYVAVEVAKHVMAENPPLGSPGATYLDEPWQVFAIWNGGLVMYGGFFGAIVLGTWKAHQYGLRPLRALDMGLVAGFAGQMIGRIGCILVGDDFGSIVPERFRHLPFPITLHVPEKLRPASLFKDQIPPLEGEVLWAVQIWMSVNAGLLALVGLRLLRRRRWAGETSAVLILLYAITRSVIEMFRGDTLRGVWVGGLSTSQLISIPAAGIAAWVLYRNRGRRESAA